MRSAYYFPALGGLCLGLIFMLAAYFIQQDAIERNLEQDRAVVVERAQKLSAALSKSMNIRLNLTSSLAAFVTVNRDFTQDEFDRYASLLQKDLPGIMSLQLAPKGIVAYLTNLERNRKAIGHNLFADKKRRPLVDRAVREKSYIISGPITLVQGGKAIIARRPLFFPDKITNKETFWGFAIILIDVDILLKEANLADTEKDLHLAIRGKDGLGEKGAVFYGDETIFVSPLVLSNVALPNASWQLGVRKTIKTLPNEFLFSKSYWVFALLISIFISVISYAFFNRPRHLKNQVNLATENLRTTLNSIGDAVLATDISGNITRMNPVAEQMTGWMVEEARGQPLTAICSLIQPENNNQSLDPVKLVLKEGRMLDLAGDTTLVSKTGKEHDVAHSVAPIRDDTGMTNGVVLILRDVSAANKLSHDLMESKERFRIFANIGADWLWEMDEHLRFSFFSDEIHRVTGRPTSEYIGKTRRELQADNPSDIWIDHLEDLNRHLPFKDFRYKVAETNERQFYWSISGKPLFDKNGTFTGYRGTGTDITERVRLEEQLRRSSKMEAVGQLTGGVAHDFNNILGIAMGNLELLQEEISEEDHRRHFVSSALKAITRGAEITRKLLGFSRKDANAINLTAVNPFIENLKDLIARSVTASITVETHLADELWRVAIDPGDLEDAILNISLNARDAMPDGGTLIIKTKNAVLDEIFVRRNPEIKPGDYVLISVSDTGKGMTDDIRDKILEPFFTTKADGKGTGLGLSMVYGFVQRSGGHLDVYSEPDKGTTIRIYIPVATRDSIEPDQEIDDRGVLPYGNETIVIVDDEEGLRNIADTYLQALGYNTLTAENGTQALTLVKEQPNIDLIFSDVVMPGEMDGYQLANILHEKHPDIAVLLSSGFTKKQADIIHGDDEYLVRIDEELLSKPYSLSDFAFAVRRALDKKVA